MHANVIKGGQLDEHLFFLAACHFCNSVFCTIYIVLLFEMQIKYDDDGDDIRVFSGGLAAPALHLLIYLQG